MPSALRSGEFAMTVVINQAAHSLAELNISPDGGGDQLVPQPPVRKAERMLGSLHSSPTARRLIDPHKAGVADWAALGLCIQLASLSRPTACWAAG